MGLGHSVASTVVSSSVAVVQQPLAEPGGHQDEGLLPGFPPSSALLLWDSILKVDCSRELILGTHE